jgi:transcription factor TFIIIB component B''
VRARTAASSTPAPTESSQSLSTTPARSEPQNSPASLPPDLFDRSPHTSASVPSPGAPDHEPYEDRDASIPALGGAGESRDQRPPALEGEIAPATTRPNRLTAPQFPTEEVVHGVFSDRGSVVISIPGLGASTAPHGRNAEENGEPRQTETAEGPAQSSNGAKMTCTRKVPATRGMSKTTKTVIEALSAELPTEGIRKSARAKKGTVQEGVVEGGPVNDGQTVDDDAEDEDEYREEAQPKHSNENALTKKRKRVSRKPKKPGERRTRHRAETPPDAEERKIQEDVVKMKDLCKDLKSGKKSKKYKELESTDWNEVIRRQRAQKAELKARRASGQPVDETTEQRLDRLWQTSGATSSMAAPQMRIVDGQIVLDEESLRVDRHQRDAIEEGNMEIVEENQHSRLVNSGTWSKHEKGDRWESDATERFYETLSMFGTDFEIISKLFPGRTRRQIKNKYNCEERKNPKRITLALKHRVAVGAL